MLFCRDFAYLSSLTKACVAAISGALEMVRDYSPGGAELQRVFPELDGLDVLILQAGAVPPAGVDLPARHRKLAEAAAILLADGRPRSGRQLARELGSGGRILRAVLAADERFEHNGAGRLSRWSMSESTEGPGLAQPRPLGARAVRADDIWSPRSARGTRGHYRLPSPDNGEELCRRCSLFIWLGG